MSGKTKLSEDTIIPILDELRKPNGDKPRNGKIDPNKKLKTFADVVSDQWETLEIEGAPNPKLLELMIIKSVEIAYGDWEQEKEANVSRMKAKIRDATLLSFGLLDKCPHTRNGINVWLKERYENYLDSPDFDFMYLEYYGEGTYQEVKKRTKKGKQPRPLNKLTSLSGKGRDVMALELLKIIQTKIYKQYLDKDENVLAYELPKPCFNSNNFSPITKSEKVDITAERERKKIQESDEKDEDKPIDPNPPEPPTPKTDSMLIKITVWVKRVVVVILLIAISLLVVTLLIKPISLFLEKLNESPKPYSIEFQRTGRWLPYGEEMNLVVNPKPSDATLNGLRCKSEGDNAHVIEILSESGLHIKAIDEPEGSEKCDVDIKAYMDYDENISDVITIYVIKDGESETMGNGELNDKSSGGFSQKVD